MINKVDLHTGIFFNFIFFTGIRVRRHKCFFWNWSISFHNVGRGELEPSDRLLPTFNILFMSLSLQPMFQGNVNGPPQQQGM